MIKFIFLLFLIDYFIKAQDYSDHEYIPIDKSVSSIDLNNIFIIMSGKAPTEVSYSFITNQISYNPKLRPSGIIGNNTNIDSN
jgi:hypothetical protein